HSPMVGAFMQELIAELMKVWPDAIAVKLGKHKVFQNHIEVPAYKFEYVAKFINGPRLIELTARDSFDIRLARFMLDRIERLRISESPCRGSTDAFPALKADWIRVFAVKFPKPWPFECLAVIPPRTAKRFEYESKQLQKHTYLVVPC